MSVLNCCPYYWYRWICCSCQLFVCSCSELQSWDAWWQHMRIIRGRTEGIDGSNFYGLLVLCSVSSWLLNC